MRTLLIFIAVMFIAHMVAGCGLIPTSKTYDGSESYSEAHPDQSQPMPYMDPDHQYQSDDK